MNKVTIEITSKGWKTILEVNGKIITDENVLTSFGAQGINEALEYNEDLDEDLVEALEDCNPYKIARILKQIEETE